MPIKKYYRNNIPIDDIEEQSLWELKDGIFILVDDDDPHYVFADEHQEKFYSVDTPDELK